MNIYDEYVYIGRKPGRLRTWEGPSGYVQKEKDGTWYWEKKSLRDIESLPDERLKLYCGNVPTFEDAVQSAETPLIGVDSVDAG